MTRVLCLAIDQEETIRLGWILPDRGMRWWYDNGKSTADRILRFVADIWDADGQLDWFAAWLWSVPRLLEPERVKDATGYVLKAQSSPLVGSVPMGDPVRARSGSRAAILRTSKASERLVMLDGIPRGRAVVIGNV